VAASVFARAALDCNALPEARGVPPRSCRRCIPTGCNAPVRSFGGLDAALLIVGLAPGMKGANRTGTAVTPATYAGDLLYSTLLKFGFARGTYKADPKDGLALAGCRIANAVRCLPPENKPLPAEFTECRPFLQAEIGGDVAT